MMEKKKYAIGIDIGGTNMKLVLIDDTGKVYKRQSIKTPRDPTSPDNTMRGIINIGKTFLNEATKSGYQIQGVGFSVPHFVTGTEWTQIHTFNLPELEGFKARKLLMNAFGSSVEIINDLNGFTIAEHIFGNGRESNRLFVMAIGTGVGASVLIKGQGLVDYCWGTAGETGQIIVDPMGIENCSCGGRGCLEAYVSGPAICKRAMNEVSRGKDTLLSEVWRANGELKAIDVARAAKRGDKVACDVFVQAGFYIGVALTSYLHIFCPDKILLGGGVSQAGGFIIDTIIATMQRLASPYFLERLGGVELVKFIVDGAAIGSAVLILYPDKYNTKIF